MSINNIQNKSKPILEQILTIHNNNLNKIIPIAIATIVAIGTTIAGVLLIPTGIGVPIIAVGSTMTAIGIIAMIVLAIKGQKNESNSNKSNSKTPPQPQPTPLQPIPQTTPKPQPTKPEEVFNQNNNNTRTSKIPTPLTALANQKKTIRKPTKGGLEALIKNYGTVKDIDEKSLDKKFWEIYIHDKKEIDEFKKEFDKEINEIKEIKVEQLCIKLNQINKKYSDKLENTYNIHKKDFSTYMGDQYCKIILAHQDIILNSRKM